MNRRTKLALDRDKKIKALHGGKRISAEGNVYYENRPNRTDLNRTKKFGKGGDLWTPLDFTSIEEYFDYINDSLINGNRTQVKELYNDMDESQKRQFFRYANMQEGMFDEVVDYINENVREYAKGGVLDEKESMLYFVLNQLPSGTVANMSSFSDYKTLDKIKSQIINILQEEGDVKYSIYNLKSLIKRAEQEIEEPADRSYMNTEIGKVDVYSGLGKFKKDAIVYHAERIEDGGKSSIFWIVNKSDADKLENIGYDITKVNVKKGEKPYALTDGEIGSKPYYYANGGGVSSKKFRKGDKVLTREGKIETVLRVNKNGNIETEENDYSWSPDSLKHAKGEYANGGVVGDKDRYIKLYNERIDKAIKDSIKQTGEQTEDSWEWIDEEGGFTAEEIVGYYLEEYKEEALSTWLENVKYSVGHDTDEKVTEKLKELFPNEQYVKGGGLKKTKYIVFYVSEEGQMRERVFGEDEKELADDFSKKVNGSVSPIKLSKGGKVGVSKGSNGTKGKFIWIERQSGFSNNIYSQESFEEVYNELKNNKDYTLENDDNDGKVFVRNSDGHRVVFSLKEIYSKGGSVKQKGAQYNIDGYGSGDRKHKAKPVGFRYERIRDPKTGKLRVVTKNDKQYYATPTKKEIEAYKDGDVTARKMLGFENRKDHSDKEPMRFSRKFAKGGSVTIDGKKAMYKVKYSLDGGKQKVGYVVRDTEEDGQRVSQWLLYNNKKELVKSMSPQEAHEMVKNDKLVLAKKYDVDTEPKKEIDPDVEVKDMPYAERIEWIKNNLVPKIKSAKKVWYSFDSGNTYDLNDEKSTEKFIEDARAAADYSNTENFESSTLFITENGHSLESPDGEEFDKVVHDNTYNTSYLGVLDWDFNVFNIYDSRFVLAARPHLGGDVRGNYGDAIYFEDESKDAVLMKFYEKIVDGQRQVSIEFKGGSEVRFDATQNSDVSYYELYEDGSKLKLGSPAELLVSTFSTYGSWKGDDFVEEIVDEFERSKENKAKKMADGGGVENVQESLYVTEFYDGDGNLMGYTVKDKYNPSGKYTLSSKRERAEENRQYLIDNPSRLAYYRKNEYANGGSVGDKFQVGDLVFNRTLGSRGLVGLVVSESKYDKEYEMTEYDVLYRGYSGDIIPTEESDLVDITEGYIDFAESNGDLMHYPNIAKKQGITLNPKYQEAIDENSDEEEFAKGGGVSDTKKIKKRLEYLRKELRAERISQGELIELQSLSKYIDKGDVELLEAAGVPEFDDEEFAKGGSLKKTKAKYVELLNEIGVPEHDHPEYGGRVPYKHLNTYGLWLRKNDPIAFNVGYSDWASDDDYKKGGAIKQRAAQYSDREVEKYGNRDTSVRARPVGYRYRKIVDKNTGRLRKIEKDDKEYYNPVTQKDIQAYEEGDKSARRRIYREVRKDHSDKNPKNKRAY